jgi:hypothetical protein
MSTDQKGGRKRPFWIKNRQRYLFIMFNICLWLWKSSFEFKQIKCELFIWYTLFALYYTWMLRINEILIVVSNMFQWPKEILQVRLSLIK